MALYQQAVTSPEPGTAAEALTQLGDALREHGDYQAARAAWDQCIATGNPDWAPHAMAMLASMLESKLGDRDGALAMFQAAFDTGHPDAMRERTEPGSSPLGSCQRQASTLLSGLSATDTPSSATGNLRRACLSRLAVELLAATAGRARAATGAPSPSDRRRSGAGEAARQGHPRAGRSRYPSQRTQPGAQPAATTAETGP